MYMYVHMEWTYVWVACWAKILQCPILLSKGQNAAVLARWVVRVCASVDYPLP